MSAAPRRPPPRWVLTHLRPGENVLWWARPSLAGLVPITASALGGAVLLVVTHRLGIEDPGPLQGASALVVAALGLLFEFGRRLAQLRFTTFVVTDRHLYSITTFLTTDARSVPLSRVSHVALRQGPFAMLLGLWSARVGLYGEGARHLALPSIRDGDGLLRELSGGQRRGCDAAWLLRGD